MFLMVFFLFTQVQTAVTPRRVAVKGESLEPKTVLTVFLPAQMFFSKASARLMTSQRIKDRQRETVKTVLCHSHAVFTATRRGVNERRLFAHLQVYNDRVALPFVANLASDSI
jgi:hypothetical protein